MYLLHSGEAKLLQDNTHFFREKTIEESQEILTVISS